MAHSAPDKDFPWWLLILALIGAWLLAEILWDDQYRTALRMLATGIPVTIGVALVAYIGACLIGLGLALMGLSRRIWLRQAARFYIEVVRGVPIIVLLLYVAFALAPALVVAVNWVSGFWGGDPWKTRDFPLLARAVIALMLAYSAFLAEIFRAGLQAVDKGQIEAAQALGLTGWLRFRLVVMPQAFRTILPPLGNDFVAMVKDSSLVSVLGVADITQLGKVTAAGNFRYFETYNMVALIYLAMTITLSLGLRRIEARLRARQER